MENNWRLHHIGAVVRDLNKTVEYYRSLGIVDRVSVGRVSEGKKAKLVGKFVRIGSLNLEFWQPVRGETIQQAFLDSHGEGINHIAFDVDDFERVRAGLVEKNVPVVFISKQPVPGGYFNTSRGSNLFLEAAQSPTGTMLDINWEYREKIERGWRFLHLGAVVRDLDKTIGYYQSLGILTSSSERFSKEDENVRNDGQVIHIGSLIIELWRPVWGESIHQKFLSSYGEGVNHIAFQVDDIEKERADMTVRDIPVILSAKNQTAHISYFDTSKAGNILIELIQPLN